MVDKASSSIVIDADKQAVMAVIADLEAYPEWSTAIKSVTVDEVGDGRARRPPRRSRWMPGSSRTPTRWPTSGTATTGSTGTWSRAGR